MNTRPLHLSEKIARMLADNPAMTHSEACSILAQRRRRKNYGVLHAMNRELATCRHVESDNQQYAWMNRADLA